MIIYAPREPHERSECVLCSTPLSSLDFLDPDGSAEEGFGDGGAAPSPLSQLKRIRNSMARKNQKTSKSQAPVISSLSESLDSREDLSGYRPSDEDRVEPKIPAPAKTEEEARREYEEKCRYLESLPQTFQLDLAEIDCREFVEWIFERRVGVVRDVIPFEDEQSAEYQNWLQQKREGKKQIDYRGYACWRYNPIIFYSENGKNAHRIMLKDDEDTFRFLDNRKFALLSPITYVGRNNTSINARYLYAMGFDLDGVGIRQIKKLVWMMQDGAVPMANIITNSGHGLHLYYLLEEPVPLYKENLPLLNKLKHGLTNVIWNDRTSFLEERQHQGVLQGFRLPGTLTKFGVPIKSYHNADAPTYTLEHLNDFLSRFKLTADELSQLTKAPVYNPTGVTMEEAKRLWPEWYASKVLNHNWVGSKWHVKRDVYDWWLNKLKDADEEIKVHHRYWCILTLIIYAVKCDIPREEVLDDAYALVPKMDSYTDSEDNHFTTEDVDDAMQAYAENYNKWPIRTIEATTTFRIERNKRNSVKIGPKLHLMLARQRRDSLRKAMNKTKWDANNGRKPEAEKVYLWKKEHPGVENKSLCARETGLTRPTVIKWWNGDNKASAGKRKNNLEKERKLVVLAKLFAPGSDYTIDGFSHEELLEAVTSGKWKEMGLYLGY